MRQWYRYHVRLNDDASQLRIQFFDLGGELRYATGGRCKLFVIPDRIAILAEQVANMAARADDIGELGSALFQALFLDGVALHVRSVLEQASAETSICVELDLSQVRQPAIGALPWELLRLPELQTDTTTAGQAPYSPILLSRRVAPIAAAPVFLDDSLRILLVVASSEDGEQFDLGELREALEQRSSKLGNTMARLEVAYSPTFGELGRLLVHYRPHILHVIDHDRMPDHTNWHDGVQLQALFHSYRPSVLVLQAGMGASIGREKATIDIGTQAARSGISAVVVTQYPIDNTAAGLFARVFYDALVQLEPIDMAVQRGRRELARHLGDRDLRSAAAPMLFSNASNGQVFVQYGEREASQAASETLAHPLIRTSVDIQQFEQMSLSALLASLSDEGRQTIEIALGEALRIGHVWLGIEFLLMALSKQTDCRFSAVLQMTGVDPGELRGCVRELVGVRHKDWRDKDVAEIGAAALPLLEVALLDLAHRWDSSTDRGSYVVTPRMLAILRSAALVASPGLAGHDHLLYAMLQHAQTPVIELLLAYAYEVGWSERQLAAILPFGPITTDYGRDLTQAALVGQVRRLEGLTAHRAMTRIGTILLQKEANNPIILGPPGVGKTAVVEGFAWLLTQSGGQIAELLVGKRIIEISPAVLLADTGGASTSVEHLRRVLDEARAADGQVIVFIDAIHTILDDRITDRLGPIAAVLKSALESGEIRSIGTATAEEYHTIAQSPKLRQRFTPIWLEEPGIEEAVQIVQKIGGEFLSQHYQVVPTSEAVRAAVELSARYLHDESLPGKALKILYQAASDLDGPTVDREGILQVVAARANIPIALLGLSDEQRQLALEDQLRTRIGAQVLGMSEVLSTLAKPKSVVRRRPRGVFLLAGRVGAGPLDFAKVLAETYLADGNALLKLDMSEFGERQRAVSLFNEADSSPNSTGEGSLARYLRHYPYGVVLLDNLELAHPDTQVSLLSIFNTGRLIESSGTLVDARNAIFVMATHPAVDGSHASPSAAEYRTRIEAAVKQQFGTAFLRQLDCIVFVES